MKAEASRVISKIKKDSRVVKLMENFTNRSYYNLPVVDMYKEIEMIHSMRSIRKLKPKHGNFVEALVEACIADQSARSRLSEFVIQTHKAEKTLQKSIDALQRYIIVEYATDLAIFRTKEERVRIVEYIMEDFLNYIQDVASINTIANTIIKDVDQASWALKSIIEALKLQTKPEVSL